MGMHDVQLPFRRESCTVLCEGRGDLGVDGKRREQEDHAKGVVDVTYSVNERRIPESMLAVNFPEEGTSEGYAPLFDDMV